MTLDNDSDDDYQKDDLKTSRRLICPDDFLNEQLSQTTLDSLESSQKIKESVKTASLYK